MLVQIDGNVAIYVAMAIAVVAIVRAIMGGAELEKVKDKLRAKIDECDDLI